MFETSSAIISDCGRYRYRLDRRKAFPGLTVAWFGVNPSTAGDEDEDATTRKWHGFTQRLGFGQYIVGNVFGFRATDVRALARVDDPFGPDNAGSLLKIIEDADVLIPCWGDRAKLPSSLRSYPTALMDLLRASGKPLFALGLTKAGDPRHPLMLGYATALMSV